MSLIMDALRKAQQLRVREPQEIILPLSQDAGEKEKGSGRRRWGYIGGALLVIAALLVTSFLFWKSRPPALHTVSLEPESRASRQETMSGQLPDIPAARDVPAGDILGPSQETTEGSHLSSKIDLSSPTSNPSVSLPISTESKTPFPAKPSQYEKTVTASKAAVNPPPVKKTVPPKKRSPVVTAVPLKPKAPQAVPPATPQAVPQAPSSKTAPAGPARENPSKPAANPPSEPPSDPPSNRIDVKQEMEKGRLFNLEAVKQFNLGVQLHHQREFSKAMDAYRGVLEKDPENFEAYNNIGLIYQEMGDLERASGAYRKAIEINPRYEKGHNNLGTLLHLQGRDAEATEAFQKALAVNSSNLESHLNLGVVLTKQGLFEQAVESYRRALEINPLHRETHYNIALLYERMEQNDLAILHYGRFIQLSASNTGLVLKVSKHLENLLKSEKMKGE